MISVDVVRKPWDVYEAKTTWYHGSSADEISEERDDCQEAQGEGRTPEGDISQVKVWDQLTTLKGWKPGFKLLKLKLFWQLFNITF